MMSRVLSAALWICLTAAQSATTPQPAEAPTKVLRLLVVTGGHDYPTSFYTVFEGYDDLTWDHAVSAEEAYGSDLRAKYDVLVLYDMSKELSPEGRANLRAFAESGKGIVVVHHALVSYPGWPWYEALVGGRYLEGPAGGRGASTYQHDVDFTLRPAASHSVTAGLGPILVHDETYKGVSIHPSVRPLLTTDHPSSDGVVAWVSPYPLSRVVTVQPGHGPEVHRHPAYRRLLHQAIRWVAGRG